MGIFKRIFCWQYRLNLWNFYETHEIQQWGDATWATMRGFTAVAACQTFNVFTIIELLDDFAGTKLWDNYVNRWDTLEFCGIALGFLVLSIFVTFGPIPNPRKMIDEFEKRFPEKAQRKKSDWSAFSYCVVSFLLFIVAMMINPASWRF